MKSQIIKKGIKIRGHVIAVWVILLSSFLSTAGCGFLGGAVVGAAGAGAAYEVNAKSQLNRLEEDYKAGRITQQEYESRKKQIESGSIIY